MKAFRLFLQSRELYPCCKSLRTNPKCSHFPFTQYKILIPCPSHSRTSSDQFACFNTSINSQDDAHRQYLNQIRELEEERTQLLGQDPTNVHEFTSILDHNRHQVLVHGLNTHAPVDSDTEDDAQRESRLLKEDLENRFQFTQEDYIAWTHIDKKQGVDGDEYHHSATQVFSNMNTLARRHEDNNDDNANPSLTHWDSTKEQVTMVDVTSKLVTLRHATAQTILRLPQEVMEVLLPTITEGSTGTLKELQGPKGPIFATARIAGIMAAKRTSELIPLCHPLPLEKIDIDIQLSNNIIMVECRCSVHHRTGVEMEALMGASISALTIYDMIKALSHHVTIENTKLVHKSGGKTEFTIKT